MKFTIGPTSDLKDTEVELVRLALLKIFGKSMFSERAAQPFKYYCLFALTDVIFPLSQYGRT